MGLFFMMLALIFDMIWHMHYFVGRVAQAFMWSDALVQFLWGDPPQGNLSRSHIPGEAVSPVPLQPGTRGDLLQGGQHAQIHTHD